MPLLRIQDEDANAQEKSKTGAPVQKRQFTATTKNVMIACKPITGAVVGVKGRPDAGTETKKALRHVFEFTCQTRVVGTLHLRRRQLPNVCPSTLASIVNAARRSSTFGHRPRQQCAGGVRPGGFFTGGSPSSTVTDSVSITVGARRRHISPDEPRRSQAVEAEAWATRFVRAEVAR